MDRHARRTVASSSSSPSSDLAFPSASALVPSPENPSDPPGFASTSIHRATRSNHVHRGRSHDSPTSIHSYSPHRSSSLSREVLHHNQVDDQLDSALPELTARLELLTSNAGEEGTLARPANDVETRQEPSSAAEVDWIFEPMETVLNTESLHFIVYSIRLLTFLPLT